MTDKVYARVDGGAVAEIVTLDAAIDIVTAFAAALVFVDITVVVPQPQVGWTYNGVVFAPPVGPTLEQVQTAQIAVLTAACDAEIAAGYTSTALGTAHTYPTKTTDQLNMSASVVASLLPGIATDWTTPFWCADGTGAWAMRAHTAAQIQQAGSDGKALIQAAQVKLAALSVQVMAAADAAAVQAVAW